MDGAEIAKPKIVCILGPTGIGKTALALELAARRGGEIVSADSMQVYRHMDIGSAKPTLDERKRVFHHLIDVVDPDEPFDASRYVELAHGIIADLQQKGKPVFLVGGTGLYIRALLGGLIHGPGADEALRRELKQEVQRKGKEQLYRKLLTLDPDAAHRIHPHDSIRIIRALEVLEITGRSIVAYHRDHGFRETPYETLRIGLHLDRGKLKGRIERRVDRMISDGFPEEVRRLLGRGYPVSLKPMKSLGYRSMVSFLAGDQSLADAVRATKRDTWRYAKRQMTWFAADREVAWFRPEDLDAVSERVERFLDFRRS